MAGPLLREDWAELSAATDGPAAFDPAAAAELPAPVRRWLAHAVEPGVPLWRSLELTTAGSIRLGEWR
ncbi:hypothetical protein F0L68_15075 [Solihabitans fulvus]|uniref:Uncharacterized protein n=1 Tax=Solihabitans fulvus TaxID=1892852 RepID=A0A5B2XG24_9PSEU|nr:DUF6544 family protein [Solihabitans fulvus]KAA2261841.1 hypothetical protein F0L68_15075 [Solihabitans fulvus]